MKRIAILITVSLAISTSVQADEPGPGSPVVIDTDMGIDDVAALALALQHPRIHISAVVACEGVAGSRRGAEMVGRMLKLFNRTEIPLYGPAKTPRTPAPPRFRAFAEQAVARALPDAGGPAARSFSPRAFRGPEKKKVVVLALGPLTNLAAALEADPALARHIERIVYIGQPGLKTSWNTRFDVPAARKVFAAGIPIAYVARGPGADKPRAWRKGPIVHGRPTSLAAILMGRLLKDRAARRHYVDGLARFTDELGLLYLDRPHRFQRRPLAGRGAVVQLRAGEVAHARYAELLAAGRQEMRGVVLSSRRLPPAALRPDLRRRMNRIIARHGQVEWRAQLLMNELHQHLGAYSVVGVKMGLRAAELLNAPGHGIRVVSNTAARPPVSCLNDGIIVATGATPGRALFTHRPGADRSTRVTFSYRNRSVTLSLAPKHQQKIAAAIKDLLKKYSLADPRYWRGVRARALAWWEGWHRLDIFRVSPTP